MNSAVIFALFGLVASQEPGAADPAVTDTAATDTATAGAADECTEWWWYMEGEHDKYQVYEYDDCLLTFGEWYENPLFEEHVIYEAYNEGELICMYWSEDDYENCFAYFQLDATTWEFAEGGAWIWHNCGETYYDNVDKTEDECYAGEWPFVTRDDFDYSDIHDDDMVGFYYYIDPESESVQLDLVMYESATVLKVAATLVATSLYYAF